MTSALYKGHAESYPRVQGRCPNGCGATLFLGSGGYVTCSLLSCPKPDAASELLAHADKVKP